MVGSDKRGWSPPSPIQESLHYLGNMVTRGSPWRDWMPKAWHEQREKPQEWLVETFRDDARFAPIDENWLNSRAGKGLYSEKILRLLESLGRFTAEGESA